MKRAFRLDKARVAALEQVLRLYLDPDRLPERVPALGLLVRPADEIRATAERILPPLQAALPDRPLAIEPCRSQIGSGGLPVDLLPSFAITIGGPGLDELSRVMRALPRPVIGRLNQGRLWLDCRCLEQADEALFVGQLPRRS
jgi:L-seryl-tRNA(Ser) seleniumtransferase